IRESLDAIDWSAGPVKPVAAPAVSGLPANIRGEQLVRCRYFELDRFEVDDVLPVAPGRLSVAPGRLSIWMVLEGIAELQSATYRRTVRRGDTVLVPALAETMQWRATTGSRDPTLLRVQLPHG